MKLVNNLIQDNQIVIIHKKLLEYTGAANSNSMKHDVYRIELKVKRKIDSVGFLVQKELEYDK